MTTSGLFISDPVFAELTATCDAIGYNDGDKFHLDRNSIEALKDLIRYLRRDDDTHQVRRFLGEMKLLQKDLIQILIQYANQADLWNVLLRLLINLTSPALMVYNEELPTEKITRSYYLQILSHLQEYKNAMANDAVWTVIHEQLKNVLSIDSVERGEENELIIERILTLIRNVLRVPACVYENRTDYDTSVHDMVLFALNTSGMSDLLVYIASTSAEQQYHMHILEIIAFMLQNQNPAKLATAEMQRNTQEKAADEAKLILLRQKETVNKMAKMKKYAGSRHSRFGGTFVVQNMKAIGDNEMLCHKPYQKIEDLDFSITKQKTKKRKNKNGIMEAGDERISALSVRLFLKEFCVEFLNGAYNPVMRYARSCINAGSGATVDSSHYLWALRFFMNFNRHYKFRVKYVSETISTEVFYIVQRQIEHNYEMISNDKKKVAYWSIRLHLGIKAYQELLYTLIEMDRNTDMGVNRSSRVIMCNIFYVPEYRDTILNQLLNYNELNMSRDYLVDLVTTVHIFLKMLKNFCDKQRHVVVQKLKRKKQKKKTKPPSKASAPEAVPSQSPEERWDDVGPEVSAVMQQNDIPEVTPFDAASDVPIDEQKGDAMKRIQKLLRCRDFEHAIGLLRSAREVWPENDSFGRAAAPPEEEFLALREIFLADLGVADEQPAADTQPHKSTGNEIENLLNYEGEEDDEDEDEEADDSRFEESSFKFMDFMQRFANVRAVTNLTILLKHFKKNTPELNHYVLKMFHRIAVDCKMPAMLYQASIFRVFQQIFRSDNRNHKELASFGRFVFRGFAEVAARNPKAFMEILFWKSTKQAVEMTDGYEADEASKKKASKNAWTEAEEDELRTLFMEHQTNKPRQDLIDYILENLINQDRTRRGIMKKLKEMYLIVNSKAVRAEVQKRLPKEWSEEEVEQLTELWEQVKEDDDPVGMIFDGLRIKRSKLKIKEKLLELHLVEDKKQLRKKRTKKSEGPKSSWETRSASEDEDDSGSESDEDDGTAAPKKDKKKKKERKEKKERKKTKQPTIVYTDAQLSGLLKDVIGSGMQEALQWLKESLEECLEDRDEESTEGQALVPLTAETSAALEAPSFQRLMRGIGIQPPDLEEAYWRIPATMLTATMEKRCDVIEAALRGEFVEEATASNDQNESSDDDDVFERVKKYGQSNHVDKDSNTSNSEKSDSSQTSVIEKIDENIESQKSDKENHDTANKISLNDNTKVTQSQESKNLEGSEKNKKLLGKSQNAKSTPKSKQLKSLLEYSDSEEEGEEAQTLRTKITSEKNADTSSNSSQENINESNQLLKELLHSDSDEEKMETETNIQSKVNPKEGSAKSSRIRKVLDSDSEEENEKVLETENELLDENKRIRSENSDTESPAQKKRRILDSDEEDNVTKNDKSIEKKQVRVLSDDED